MKTSASTAAFFVAAMALFDSAVAANAESKAELKLARQTANDNYKMARKVCDSLAGNPKDVCVAQARADRVKMESEANAHHLNTMSALTDARKKIASANYDVAKTKCNSYTGNEKDICIRQAKAQLTAATADANADKKVVEARLDARNDKAEALYKLETEKCDALAGAAKKECLGTVKQRFESVMK